MQWTESITVDAPLARVRAAVADQHELMSWSAWQEATGYVCTVEGDGRSVGSSIDLLGVRPGGEPPEEPGAGRAPHPSGGRLPARAGSADCTHLSRKVRALHVTAPVSGCTGTSGLGKR